MSKEIKSTILLVVVFMLIGAIWYFAYNGFFSSSWTRTYVNGKEVVYKVPGNFRDCSTLNELAGAWRELQKELSQERLTKVQYLDTIFRAFCIDYESVEVSPDLSGEAREKQKIITKAIELGVLKSDAENPFKPDIWISKIEALALLFRASWLELKWNFENYNFRDVDDNWKKDVAAKATHLSIVYTSTSKNRFYPNTTMNKWDAYKMLKEVARYYK